MSLRPRQSLLGALALATVMLGAPLARAAAEAGAARPATATERDALAATCSRLRAELDAASAAISALKRGDRGVREDYQLRRKQAEAESIARRLTEAETALRRLGGSTPAASPPAPRPALPVAEPLDGPGALEAKADILSDEARRLSAEADALTSMVSQARARQTLRRRAGHLDQDPFGSLEGSKRFLLTRTARPSSAGSKESTSDSANRAGGAAPEGPGNSRAGSPGVAPDPVQPTAPPPATPPTQQPADPPPKAQPQPAAPPPPPPPPQGATDTTKAPTAPGSGADSAPVASAGPAPGLLANRALLDPAVVMELKRSEAALGRPFTDLERVEASAAALRARAQALDAQAKQLRARAH